MLPCKIEFLLENTVFGDVVLCIDTALDIVILVPHYVISR